MSFHRDWCAALCLTLLGWIGVSAAHGALDATPTPTANAAKSPVGDWRWFTGQTVKFKPNGEVEVIGGQTGRWTSGNATRVVVIHWANGLADTLHYSADGQRLAGRNQNGFEVSADLIALAAETDAVAAMSAATPGSWPFKPVNAAAGAASGGGSAAGSAPGRTGSAVPGTVRIQTESDLMKLLLATAWSWERPGVMEEINFFDDGTAQHTVFRATYKIKNVHEVELSWDNRTAKMVFDDAYASYTGTDITGAAIHGQRKNEPSPSSLRAPTPVPVLDMTVALLSNSWTMNAPKVRYKERRKFNQNGSWSALTSDLKGTWKIQDNKLLVTLSVKPASPEIYHLPPRVFDLAAGKIHLEGSGANGDAVKLDIADAVAAAGEKLAPGGTSYFGTARP